MSLCAALASTSGRALAVAASSSELGHNASALCGRSLRLACRRPWQQQQQARTVRAAPVAAFGKQGKAYNKYKSRQELEVDYYKEWEQTTVVAEADANRKMNILTLLAFLPGWARFYAIPGPVRFVLYFVWSILQQQAYKLRKLAVIAGAKLDRSTMQRRGMAAAYPMRQTALRRLHGKESLLAPLALMVGLKKA